MNLDREGLWTSFYGRAAIEAVAPMWRQMIGESANGDVLQLLFGSDMYHAHPSSSGPEISLTGRGRCFCSPEYFAGQL
jgi:hypothetical protein